MLRDQLDCTMKKQEEIVRIDLKFETHPIHAFRTII